MAHTSVRDEPRAKDPPRHSDEGERRGGVLGRLLAAALPSLWIAVPILLVVLAGALRLQGLDQPTDQYFDETYYANDAQQILERGVEEGFVVHPPVGKLLISVGIAVFGFDPFGWRVASAVAGTLSVLVLYLVALRLFRHRGIAALAALLLSVDGLAFTMSRIAMLDVFLALFVLTGFWLLLLDRDRQWAGAGALATATAVEAVEAGTDGAAEERDRTLPARSHLYRWLAGLAFGLAVATKWSALLAIGTAGLFVLVSDLAWRKRLTGRLLVAPERIVASGLATLVLVPAAVYLLSYTSWFVNFEDTRKGLEQCPEGVCEDVSPLDVGREWLNEQREIAGFHRTLVAEHPYRAASSSWPLLVRPVAYHFESCDDASDPPEDGCKVAEGNVEHILGIGNPGIWWPALLAYPVVAFFAVARRDWRAWAILAFLLLQYVPWPLLELAPREEGARTVFLFYATPVVPFMALSLAYVAWHSLASRWARWVPAAIAVVAVAGFLYFFPVLAGLELPRPSWDDRMWRQSWI